MSKLLLWLSLIATAVLFAFGLFDPNSSVMWLASTTENFAFVRVAMIAILLGLIVTKPPRNNLFRLVVGIFSVSLAYYALSATYANSMQFLDTAVMLSFSICCGLTVLELDERKLSSVPALGMRRLTASIYAAYTVRNGKL